MYAALRGAGGGASPRAVAATLEGLFGAEAAERRGAVQRLLALPVPGEDWAQASPRTVVFARRPVSGVPEPLDPVTVLPTVLSAEIADTRVAAHPAPPPSPPARAPRALGVALAGALVALGAAVGFVAWRRPHGPPEASPVTPRAAGPAAVQRAPAASPSAIPAPRVASGAARPPAPRPPVDPGRPSPRPEASPAPAPRPQGSEPAAAPPAAVAEPPAAPPSLESLQARAESLRAAIPPEDPRAVRVERLLGRLALAGAAAGTDRGRAQLEGLARELEGLERGPR
jgi:hypothetical protein